MSLDFPAVIKEAAERRLHDYSPIYDPLSSSSGVQARGGYLPAPSRSLRREGSHSCPDARYGRTVGGEEQTHSAPGTQASGLQPR